MNKERFFSVNKKTDEMKLHLVSAKRYYSSRVSLNVYELTAGEYTVVFKCIFLQHLLTIYLLTYQPPGV